MSNVILKNFQSPGDLVMLTAALRDLHLSHPKKFRTEMETSCPALWQHNPYVSKIEKHKEKFTVVKCEYPLIHESNRGSHHFIHGFIKHLEKSLEVPIRPTAFKGDIHLSSAEKSWMSQVNEITGEDTRFWIIVAGGKNDFTIKWWSHQRWQSVVDHFKGRLLFVQVGEGKHHHPPLKDVLDLRGKTDFRQLIRLVYHADGIICPVTSLMHLSAAVEYKRNPQAYRPCVVVAGGREPNQWEAYPGHQFLHTIGMLPCCASGGCWKSRTVPLGDKDAKDSPASLCKSVINDLPQCMDMITAEQVIHSIELYLKNCPWLSTTSPKTLQKFQN